MGGIRTLALGQATALLVAPLTNAAPRMTLTSISIKDSARIPVRFGARDQFLAQTKGHRLTSATIGGLFAREYQ